MNLGIYNEILHTNLAVTYSIFTLANLMIQWHQGFIYRPRFGVVSEKRI